MAIEWTHAADHKGDLKDTYEGRVLSERTRYGVRVMSDVWADMFYAKVWTGTEVTEIGTGNSEFGSEGKVVVDATPETKAAVKAWEEAQEAERLAAWEAAAPEREARRLREEAADRKRRLREVKAWLNTPEKGDRVTVARRRGSKAPPKGTEGKVIWTGLSGMGTPRVGILDDSGAKHWTTAGNCDVLRADAPTDADEVEVWEAFASEVKATREADAKAKSEAKKNRAETELAALPQKGAWVRLKADPNASGTVFWRGLTKNGAARIGFKVRKKDRDAHWAGFRNGEPEFEVLTGNPRTGGVPVVPATVVPATVVPATVVPATAPEMVIPDEEEKPFDAPVDIVITPRFVDHLPSPFNEIRRVVDHGGRGLCAYTEDGTFVAELPPSSLISLFSEHLPVLVEHVPVLVERKHPGSCSR